MPTQQAALACPRGDLSIHHCRTCDMIWNEAFEPDAIDYSSPYEASQMASAVFRDSIADLAQTLVDRYELHGKHVVEVGCGDGEFLRLLCRLGNNRGVGYEPNFTGNLEELQAEGITIVADFFGPEYAGQAGDFVASRHVLEHVVDPVAFMKDVAAAAEIGRPPIFVEVPNVAWSLSELAFWDFYYEHSLYFTAAAARQVVGRAGLELIEVGEVFGGQFLWVQARAGGAAEAEPGAGPGASPPEPANTPPVEEMVARFAGALPAWRERLGQLFRGSATATSPPALWGAGAKAVALMDFLGLSARDVPYVVDINPRKWDTYLPGSGIPVVAPSHLAAMPVERVVVLNPHYTDEIRTTVEAQNTPVQLLPLDRSHLDNPG